MGEPSSEPASSGWSALPSRSVTNRTTPSRSRSGFGRLVAGTSFRSTSRSGSTTANGGFSREWSGCGASRSRAPVNERRPLGFGRLEAPVAPAESTNGTSIPTVDDRTAAGLIPPRPPRGHKGSFGKLLVIAGSLDYAGAALLVCRAAGRTGAGLVTLAVPESLQPLFAAKVIEATTMGLPEDDVEEVDPEGAIARILDHDHDAIVLGPGLRPGLATAELVRMLLAAPDDDAEPAPMVLDAEALRSMATLGDWWAGSLRPCVLTPHPGEFERLRSGAGVEAGTDGDLSADDDARRAAALSAAEAW